MSRAFADHIAEIDGAGDSPGLDVGEHRPHGGDVAVDVWDDSDPVDMPWAAHP
jgi:hypothetical protein